MPVLSGDAAMSAGIQRGEAARTGHAVPLSLVGEEQLPLCLLLGPGPGVLQADFCQLTFFGQIIVVFAEGR